MVHIEAILTQLVFEHSMRIRLNDTDIEDNESKIGSSDLRPPNSLSSSRPPSDSEPSIQAETIEGGEATPLLVEDFESGNNREDSNISPVGPQEQTAEATKQGKSLIGVMTNLVTTDLAILKMPSALIIDTRQ